MVQRAAVSTLILVALLVASPGSGEGEGPAIGDTTVNSLGMTMVLLQPGSFRMGSPPGEPLRQDEERPHRVTLTRGFRIASTEVTQRQWESVMGWNRSRHKGDDLPVTSLSWTDAREFCARLSEKEGVPYRLATEAEWEYACRAGATEPLGGTERSAVAWYADNSNRETHPVGQRTPNAWGLFDMLGNVAEWTLDAYAPYPRVEEDEDPTGPAEGNARVVRGGAWRSFTPAVRCAARMGTPGNYQLRYVGLRVVQEVEGAASEKR